MIRGLNFGSCLNIHTHLPNRTHIFCVLYSILTHNTSIFMENRKNNLYQTWPSMPQLKPKHSAMIGSA